MHHEIFLSLLGFPGEIVRVTAGGDGYEVNPNLPFFNVSEQKVLNQVVSLGFHYQQLAEFVHCKSAQTTYVNAVKICIEEKFLQPYRAKLCSLEQSILVQKRTFPIAQFFFELEAEKEIFLALFQLVFKKIKKEKLQGAKLLDLIFQESNSGFPRVQSCMQQLLYSCNRVLFNQIVSWILEGRVIDPFNEFFIFKKNVSISAMSTSSSLMSNEMLLWQNQYTINLKAVPLSYFPISLAENILFIGKAMQILLNSEKQLSKDRQEIAKKLNFIAKRSMIFHTLSIENELHTLRNKVAGKIWKLIVVQTNFMSHLYAFKDMFLLSKGDLFQLFIEKTTDIMMFPPTNRSENDINHGIWEQIMQQLEVDDKSVYKLFSLEIPIDNFNCHDFNNVHGFVMTGKLGRCESEKCLQVLPKTDKSQDSVSIFSRPKQATGNTTLEFDCGTLWCNYPKDLAKSFSTTFSFQCDYLSFQKNRRQVISLMLQTGGLFVTPNVSNSLHDIDYFDCASGSSVIIELEISEIKEVNDNVSNEAGLSRKCYIDFVLKVKSVCARRKERILDEKKNRILLQSSLSFVQCEIEYLAYNLIHKNIESSNSISEPFSNDGHLSVYLFEVDEKFEKVSSNVEKKNISLLQIDIMKELELFGSLEESWIGVVLTSGIKLLEWSFSRSFFQNKENTEGPVGRVQINSKLSSWAALSMHYKLEWPLYLIFTPSILRSYKNIFRFLFHLKRLSFSLHSTWQSNFLRSSNHQLFQPSLENKNLESVLRFKACLLRHRMSFLINYILLHFQLHVIEGNFVVLVNDIEKTNDFELVKKLHENFVGLITKKLYLGSKTVQNALEKITTVCWQFAEFVHSEDKVSCDKSTLLAEKQLKSLELMSTSFDRSSSYLFTVLERTDARDLILQLDYNSFFSKAANELVGELALGD